MDPKGRGVLVTGGSKGLGRAFVEALAAKGARVVAVARGREALDDVVASVRARGGEAHAIVADVADKDATYAIAGAAAALVGPIDLLVHDASTLGPVPLRLALDTDCEDLERALAVNVVGPFRLTKAIAGSMAMRGVGAIVAISSDAAISAYPRWGAYGASKAAFDHLSKVLAAELEGTGVRVLVVDPGEMETRMHRDAFGADHDPNAVQDPRDAARRIVSMIEDGVRAKTGARLEAAKWEVAS